MEKRYVVSRDDSDAAWDLAHTYAPLLVAQGLTPTHRVGVERRCGAWWVVLVIDEKGTER